MLGLRARIATVPLFEGLTESELDEVFELSEVRRLEPSQVLFAEGATADAVWVVLEGDMEISKAGLVLAEVTVGAVIGELSLFLSTARRSATVTAICPVTVLRMPVNLLRKRITANDVGMLKMVNNVAHQMAVRLTALNERLLNQGKKGLTVARSELRRVVL